MPANPFPETLTVLHGAPVLHVPKGSRERTVTLVRTATEAAVGRSRDANFAPVHVPQHGHAYFACDGALWARLAVRGSKMAWTPVTPEAFAGVLARPANPDDLFRLATLRAFGRTPLSPRDRVAGRKVAFEAKRAQGVDLARGPSLVLLDGRDRCAAELRRFLAEEVSVTERSVYYRTAPLIRATFASSWKWHVDPCRTFEPGEREMPPRPGPGRVGGAGTPPAMPFTRITEEEMPCVDALRQAGWLRRHGNADLAIAANALPGWILGAVAARGAGLGDGAVPADLQERLRGDAFLAMTGSIPAEEIPAALNRVAEALAGLADHDRRRGGVSDDIARAQLRHLRARLLPRANRPATAPVADVEALSALAP